MNTVRSWGEEWENCTQLLLLADFFWHSRVGKERKCFFSFYFVHHIQILLYKDKRFTSRSPQIPRDHFAWWKSPDLLCTLTALQESLNIFMWLLQLTSYIDVNHLDWETQKTYLVEGTAEPWGKTSLTAQSSQTAPAIQKPPSEICCTSLHHFFTRHRQRALKWRAERSH